MAWDGVMVRYGEIGIKSAPVRRQMERRLRQNLLDGMLRDGIEGNAEMMGSRLWLTGPDADALVDLATRTFGIVSVSRVRRCDATMEAMGDAAAKMALEHEWTSFAVRARRQGHHDFSSSDMGIQVGSAIFKAAEAAGRKPTVDLDAPDFEINVEVRDRSAYLSTSTQNGPGGLPMGAQGKAAVLLNDVPSAVSAWLMMRRGCSVVPVHAGDMGSAPMELCEALQRWGMTDKVQVLPVCSGAVGKAALFEAAVAIAKKRKATAIVTGETLDSHLIDADLAVLRPVCGLDPAVIEDIAKRIGVAGEDPASDVLVAEGGEDASGLLRMHQVVSV